MAVKILNPVSQNIQSDLTSSPSLATPSSTDLKVQRVALPNLQTNKKRFKEVNLTWEFIKVAVKTQNKIAEKTRVQIKNLDQDAATQKILIALKKELLSLNEKKLSPEAQKQIELLKQRGITFKISEPNKPSAEEVEKQVDIELDLLRFSIKDKYQKIEDQNRDQKAIFDIAQKVLDLANRLVEKILSRINK